MSLIGPRHIYTNVQMNIQDIPSRRKKNHLFYSFYFFNERSRDTDFFCATKMFVVGSENNFVT